MIKPPAGGYLEIRGKKEFILIGINEKSFHLFIETGTEEISQFLDIGDLIVVSAPEGGEFMQAAILLELVRTYHVPLVVLPKSHPGSKRLNMVVSAGPMILLACNIMRGTHPEQHLLCSGNELSGLIIEGVSGMIYYYGISTDISVIEHSSIISEDIQ